MLESNLPFRALPLLAALLALAGCFHYTSDDDDGDGWAAPEDCDDTNPRIYPGAPDPDPCVGINLNCRPVVCDNFGDVGGGEDRDGDGFVAGIDCDDSDPSMHPFAIDPAPCDLVDENCDWHESTCEPTVTRDEDAGG